MQPEEIERIGLDLTIEDALDLHLVLADDGGISRLGPGGAPATPMCMGRIDPATFVAVRALVGEDLLAHTGRYADPRPQGRRCRLVILFESRSQGAGLQFDYGSESQGPPPPVTHLVRQAVALTDDWYGAQSSPPAS